MAERALARSPAPDDLAIPGLDVRPLRLRPQPKACPNRRVGTVQIYAPRKAIGVVADDGGIGGAIFCIDDVLPCDRTRIAPGQTVSFVAIEKAEGLVATQVQVDTTTLPPLPADPLIRQGWR